MVDERGHRRERRATGTEDDRVPALQHLCRDVGGDVRSRLEVRADDPDRDPPLGDAQAVRERPLAHVARDRLQRRRRADARGDRGQPLLVEPQPVERAVVERLRRGAEVACVRGQDCVGLGVDELRRARQGALDALVGERRQCRARRACFRGDELDGHLVAY